MAVPSQLPPYGHKIAATALDVPSKLKVEEKAVEPAKSLSFIRNKTRGHSRLPYSTFCLDQSHMTTSSYKRDLVGLVTLPALPRILTVSLTNIHLSCYTVKTLKAGTMFHQYAMTFSQLVLCWTLRGPEQDVVQEPVVVQCTKNLLLSLVPPCSLRNAGALVRY